MIQIHDQEHGLNRLFPWICALALAAALLCACFTGCGAQRELTVFAAASMTETLTELGDRYMAANPNVGIVFNFDSSGTLKTQIVEGADCDGFISAANKQMNQIDEENGGDTYEGTNFVMPGTRVKLLENKCALIVSPSSDKDITDWDSFQDALHGDADAKTNYEI